MDGIVSLLDEQHQQQVLDVWKELEIECGLKGIQVTPLPHFSWSVASSYDLPRLQVAMNELAARARPFPVRSSGLGIFTGENPVLFIALVKDRLLMEFHRLVWEKTLPACIEPNMYYVPPVWVPHITLAYGDLDAEAAGCALQRLAIRDFHWEMQVNNLALISQANGVGEESLHFTFST